MNKEETLLDIRQRRPSNGAPARAQETPWPPHREAIEAARIIDARLKGRALMLGPLPPEGRDLDLVVRGPERDAAASALAAQGFLPRGPRMTPRRHWVEQWARFRGGAAFSVDLNPAERWGLPDSELAALFAEARPLDGTAHIGRPAPHHVLLLAARRLARHGVIDAKRQARIERALVEDPDAWELAWERAPRWGLRPALSLLQATYAPGAAVPRLARARALASLLRAGGGGLWSEVLARRLRSKLPRRTRVVSLSGLDGAGKSSQTKALQETLEALGVDVVVDWMPLGHSPRYRTIRLLRTSVNAALRLGRRVRGSKASLPRAEAAAANGMPTSPAKALRQRSNAVTHGWATVVALHQALQHRKSTLRHLGSGKVVIFDRYTLDAAAQLRYFYGSHHAFRFQKWLVQRVSPRARRSYFLEVRPETAFARKEHHYDFEGLREHAELYAEEAPSLPVVRLDGERPREELSERIAREVWEAVG
jgi:thymidylate kinase